MTFHPISAQQERLCRLAALPSSEPITVFTDLSVEGELDSNLLAASLISVMNRHEALRTCFSSGFQMVDESAPLPLDEVRAGDCESALRYYAAEETARGFDLSRAPLWRIRLVRRSARETAVLFTAHHAICDGWSLRIFLEEAIANYRSLRDGEAPVPRVPVEQPSGFAQRERAFLASPEGERRMDWWRAHLSNVSLDALPSSPASYEGTSVAAFLPAPALDALETLARRAGCTLFSVLLGGFADALSEAAGRRNLVIGVPEANRDHPGARGAIGLYARSLLVALQPQSQDLTIMARRAHSAMQSALAHAVPTASILQAIWPHLYLRRTAGAQVQFTLIPSPRWSFDTEEFSIQPLLNLRAGGGYALADLNLFALRTPFGLHLIAMFNRLAASRYFVERLLNEYVDLLGAADTVPAAAASNGKG